MEETMEEEEEIFTFRDTKPTPDLIHPYSDSLKNDRVPIIIDHGSFLLVICKMSLTN